MGQIISHINSSNDVIRAIIIIAIGFFACWLLLRLNKVLFRNLQKTKGGLHLIFFERVMQVVIVVACVIITISAFGGMDTLWKTVLGGTAITSAVIAFAAQDVIRDLLAGLMISLNKPFEVGNRIELEDGTGGIVEDMNARQIVLRGIDTIRYIVPNSRAAAMRLTNYSYLREDRSYYFKFFVGYDSDMQLVKNVIAMAVEESPFSKPKTVEEGGQGTYAPVCFLEFAESALVMGVTVYYESGKPTELVRNDINTRVREALIANNIEIPYPYVTVVGREKASAPGKEL